MAYRHTVQAKAHGGKVKKRVEHDAEIAGEAGIKRGGRAKHKDGGKVVGRASGGRLDKRARGGGVGSDKNPFSSAHIKGHAPAHHPSAHKRGGAVSG